MSVFSDPLTGPFQNLRSPLGRFTNRLGRVAPTPLFGLALLFAALLLPHQAPAQSSLALGSPRSEGFQADQPSAASLPVLGLAPERHRLTQRFLNGRHLPARASQTSAAALVQARAQHARLLAQPRLSALTASWQPLGPSSIVSPAFGHLTGRISALALDPNDATGNTLYVGTTGGGVWKSTNAAGPLASATFTPLTDTLPAFSANAGTSVIPSLSIGALAVQPSFNPVVLAGTGDPNDATDSLYGEGLLRSTDGGLTWTLIQNSHDGATGNHSFLGLATAGIAFSSATPSLVVAAFSVSPQSAIVAATGSASIPGLYYSTDGGQTWQMSTVYDGGQIVQQPQPLGTGGIGNAATSVVWDAQRGRFYAALRSHGYYSSPDGATWTRLAAQPGPGLAAAKCPVGYAGQGSANCPIFRGTLAVQPATGDLYALTIDINDTDGGLWQDLCNPNSAGQCSNSAPAFSTRLDNGALDTGSTTGTIAQGSYNLSLAAAPAGNGTDLFVGTVDLYRCNLGPERHLLHAAQHHQRARRLQCSRGRRPRTAHTGRLGPEFRRAAAFPRQRRRPLALPRRRRPDRPRLLRHRRPALRQSQRRPRHRRLPRRNRRLRQRPHRPPTP